MEINYDKSVSASDRRNPAQNKKNQTLIINIDGNHGNTIRDVKNRNYWTYKSTKIVAGQTILATLAQLSLLRQLSTYVPNDAQKWSAKGIFYH